MKKKIILLYALLMPLAVPSLARAITRQEIMEETLQRMETPRQNPVFYNYFPIESEEVSKPNPDISKGNLYISGGYNANHMHYKELEGSDTLDEDYGKLEGYFLNIGFKSDAYLEWLKGKPFFEGYFRSYSALITYDGQIIDGPPFSFEERAKVHRYGLKLGVYTDFTNKGEFFSYFDAGTRIWYRGENEIIDGVTTYAEKYSWIYFGLGMGINYRLTPKLSSGIEFEWLFTPSTYRKMRADLGDGYSFKLGNIYGVDVKIPIRYHFSKNFSFDLTPYFTYWHIGQSEYIHYYDSYYLVEPKSNTHIEGLLTGFTYSF